MLNYHGRYSLQDILEMTYSDRDWFIQRLIKQRRYEEQQFKKAKG